MIGPRLTALATIITTCLGACVGAHAGAVAWISQETGSFYLKEYPEVNTPMDAVSVLVAGPTSLEVAQGLTSAIPPGTRLLQLEVVPGGAIVDLSAEAAVGLDETSSEMIFRQVMYTLRQFELDSNVRVLVEGKAISDYLAPVPPAIYSAPAGPAPSTKLAAPEGVGLSGKRITLSPGHGYLWTGSYWATQRGGNCGNPPEDFHNLKIAWFLKAYLEGDGAYVQPVREFDQSRGNGPSGHPWWQEAAYAWLRDAGYSCSVYASSSGICDYTGAVHRSNDDIRSRPLASNLDSRGNTDIYVSIHTNAYQGDCYGSSCPSGTDVFYTNDLEHAPWGPASITLAQYLHDRTIDAINAAGETRADGAAWGCHGSCSAKYGNFGETRIPQRPAALLELGFHDSCSTDAPKMEQPFFQSVAMWGMYNGICQYFGNTPTWAMYSSEYVSDTIPASMHTGETVPVSITFRNRGVLWDEAHGFRLGAVGDSDPFAGNRQSLGSASINPGATATFTFNFVAPSTPGTYITDWRMVRDGHAWFGETLSKQVVVQPGTVDIEPPSVPGNLQSDATDYNRVNLSWTASTDNVAVTSYEVWRNGTLAATVTHPTTAYSDTGRTQGTTYTYQVRAKDSSNNYSDFSNSSSAKTWTIVAQDSFANLNAWTPAQVADGTIRGCTLDAGTGSDLPGGSGPPSARADVGSAGTNGSYSYLGFPASFAVGYIECSFKDTSTSNNSRQGISFRKFLNDNPTLPRLVYFLGLDSTLGYGGYDCEVFSASAGWTKHQDTGGGRIIGWRRFKVAIDGSNALFYVDGNLKDTFPEPVEGPEGCNRFYIGYNYNVNQTGWYDDFLAVFPSPPTPAMGAPSGVGTDRITWNYTEGSKDWEQGFYIRDTDGTLKASGARNSTSVTETGLSPNTTYSRTVSAYNGTLESNASSAQSATTLSTPPTAGSISASPPTATWTNGAFSFTSTVPFGAGGVDHYRYHFDQSPTHSWDGTEPAWTGGTLMVSAATTGANWYLHVRGFNSAGVANGTLDLGPFYYDGSGPIVTVVDDGGEWTASTSKLSAAWAAADAGSGIASYEYALGTSPGGADVRDWTPAGSATEVTAGGLGLSEGNVYYFSVRATDAVGNVGPALSSDGIRVAPLAARISDARLLPAGAPCRMLAKPVVAAFGSRLYIEEPDRSAAIAIVSEAAAGVGDLVDLAGVLSASSEERSIACDYAEVVGTGGAVAPMWMLAGRIGGADFGPTPGAAGGLGLNNVGLLVGVCGLTSGRNPETGEFRVSDGSGSVKVLAAGLTLPDDGAFVRVVGVSRLDGSLAPFVAPRSQADIMSLQ